MIYLSKTNRDLTQKYINFAQKGLQGSIQLDPLDIINKTDCDKTVIFGILRGTNLVYQWAKKNKIDFYYMDRPYWGETRKHPFYLRVVKNNHLKNWLENRPDGRFKNRVQPRRSKLSHRSHETQKPDRQLQHRSGFQSRRQNGPNCAGQKRMHLFLLCRSHVRLDGC